MLITEYLMTSIKNPKILPRILAGSQSFLTATFRSTCKATSPRSPPRRSRPSSRASEVSSHARLGASHHSSHRGVSLPVLRGQGLPPQLRNGHRLAPPRPRHGGQEDHPLRRREGHRRAPVRGPRHQGHLRLRLQHAGRRARAAPLEGDRQALPRLPGQRRLHADGRPLPAVGQPAGGPEEPEDRRRGQQHDLHGPADRPDLPAVHRHLR